MLVAVLSDIHGNRPALEAVLADVDRRGVDEVWCLGDVVGYGADPGPCIELTAQRATICLAGNHDLAVTGELNLHDFSPAAALAAAWTREVISDAARATLEVLRPSGERAGVGLYHGSPRDPVWEYVLSGLLADLCFDAMTDRVALIGHSHIALSFWQDVGGPAVAGRRGHDDVADLRRGRWLLNPGSVGQPRDGDPRAAWMLIDTSRDEARWQRTEYDIASAQAAIRATELPESLADRLEYGQ